MKEKKGYVLVYSVIAMLLTCALVLSTVTIVLYYGNNVNRTVGGNGALYVADSGVSAFEDYLNAYYIDKGNIKTNAEDLWVTVYDIVEEIVPVISPDSDGKALLALQGHLNYNYVISAATGLRSLSADENLSGAYKVYLATQKKSEIRNNGKITLLSVGEYVYQNKSYYKFITVEAVIEPIYESGMITGLRLKTVDYSESVLSSVPPVFLGVIHSGYGTLSHSYQSDFCVKNFFVYLSCTSKSGISLVSVFAR